jgi:hypothetical protein
MSAAALRCWSPLQVGTHTRFSHANALLHY